MSVVEELRAIAAGNPENRAENKYAMNGQPCCIVGCFLHRNGFTVDELAEIDAGGLGGYGINSLPHEARWIVGEPNLYPDAVIRIAQKLVALNLDELDIGYLADAQGAQDSGDTWAAAIEIADRDRPLREAQLREGEIDPW